MVLQSSREYLEAIRNRYRISSRKETSIIIEEVCAPGDLWGQTYGVRPMGSTYGVRFDNWTYITKLFPWLVNNAYIIQVLFITLSYVAMLAIRSFSLTTTATGFT